jgi:multiple sugar transport system substrate-binding protein
MTLRRTQRRGPIAAAAVALTLGATACSGGTGGVADPGGGGGGGGDTLTLWHMEQPPNRVDAWQALIDRYNETDPEFAVEQQVQDWNQIYTKIAGAVQSSTQPDILFTLPDFTTYVRPLGKVRPVTEVVEEIDGEHGYSEAATAPYTDEGEVWAVPMYGMVQMLWYRKDLLAEAGIDEGPRTWEDLLAAAEAATKDGQSGIALPAGKNLATDQVVYSLMLTNGAGNFFTEDGQPDFDRPEVVETFEFYDRLMEFSPPDSANYSWGEPQAAFNSGAAAMAIEKGQYLLPFEDESGRPAEDLGCAPIPQPAEGGQSGSIYYSNAAMVLSEDDARAEAAQDFLAWLLDPENYGDFLNAEPGLFLPLTESGAEAESWTSHDIITKYRECVDMMMEQAESGALFGFTEGQYVDKIGNISGQNIIAQVIQQITVEGKDPAEAVAAGQKMMQDAVQG